MSGYPASVWHIKKDNCVPGFHTRVLCGDIGQVCKMRTVSPVLAMIFELCEDCIEEQEFAPKYPRFKAGCELAPTGMWKKRDFVYRGEWITCWVLRPVEQKIKKKRERVEDTWSTAAAWRAINDDIIAAAIILRKAAAEVAA